MQCFDRANIAISRNWILLRCSLMMLWCWMKIWRTPLLVSVIVTTQNGMLARRRMEAMRVTEVSERGDTAIVTERALTGTPVQHHVKN